MKKQLLTRNLTGGFFYFRLSLILSPTIFSSDSKRQLDADVPSHPPVIDGKLGRGLA